MSTQCIISGASSGICFLILVFIFIVSIKQALVSPTRKINAIIKITYFCSIFFSILTTIYGFINSIFSCKLGDIFYNYPLLPILYTLVCTCVMLILLLRLYFTFKGSVFEITQFQKWLFIITTITGIISGFLLSVYWFYDLPGYLEIINIAVAMVVYFGNSLYGMILFAKKLYQLMLMSQSSMKHGQGNHHNNVSGNKYQFNQSQMELLHTTTKYVTLLSIAMISSWGNFICIIINIILPADTMKGDENMVHIDCVINIVCLYLQYPFANRYYDKYCVCFGKCCTYLVMYKHTKTTLHNKTKNRNTLTDVPSNTVDAECDDDYILNDGNFEMTQKEFTYGDGYDEDVENLRIDIKRDEFESSEDESHVPNDMCHQTSTPL